MEGEERDRGFTVKDRRRFSADGEARQEQDPATPTSPQPTTSAPSTAASSGPSQAGDAHSHHEHDHSDHEHAHHDHEHSDHDHAHHDHDHSGHDHAHHEHAQAGAEITFATFVISLSAQALALLGEIPDPVSRATQVDLEGARQIIDILGILSEKTRGNLDAAENSLLDNALFDLRMKFVDRAQGR